MAIKVEKPTGEQRAELERCPTWSKDVSVFDWEYDVTETCLLLEGEVRVTTADGKEVTVAAGDLVTFPKGIKCRWDVRSPVRKHYRFG